jgi:hypothetical protein
MINKGRKPAGRTMTAPVAGDKQAELEEKELQDYV